MSLCICLQNSDGLMIAADTAATITHGGKQYRLREPLQKLVQFGNFLIFMSGSAGAAVMVFEKFKQAATHSAETFQAALIEGCAEFAELYPERYASLEPETRDAGALVAEWTPRGVLVHTFQPADGFQPHTCKASPTETIPHAGGYHADEALDRICKWLKSGGRSPSMSVAIRETFEILAGDRIGGIMTLATINNHGISFGPHQPIKEQIRLPFYDDFVQQQILKKHMTLYGSYIATKEDAFPRCEMSSNGNIFAAYTNAGNKIAIDPNYAGVPSLDFYMNGTVKGKLDTISSIMELVGNGGLLLYANGGDLELNPSTGFVTVPTWYKFLNGNTDRTLGEELSEIYDRLEALEEGGA
ncbi:hypothetical protein [Paenibacillus sp. FSL M7-0420]|uniref:hypothetical protein n=1 Tax=Paenibacillus sp. FSL M7-0420 TaxID=2921609 RepID=UPI0030FCC573